MAVGNERQWRFGHKWLAEIVVLLVLGTMAAAVVLSALTYPPGSVLYPLVISALLLLLVLLRLGALAIEGAQARPLGAAASEAHDEGSRADLSVRSTVIYAVTIIALIASLNFIWFPVAASVAGALVLRCVYGTSWRSSLLGALLISASSSLLFWALGAPLPGPGV